MEERRGTPRQRVFKAGSIEFDGSDIDCTIRNISPAGAALDVASPVGIPHELTLNVLTRKMRQHCYIIWRKERRIGVAFD
jgi:PilZ domain